MPNDADRKSGWAIGLPVIAALSGGAVGIGGYQALIDPTRPADVERRVISLEERIAREIKELRQLISENEQRAWQKEHAEKLDELKMLILEKKEE